MKILDKSRGKKTRDKDVNQLTDLQKIARKRFRINPEQVIKDGHAHSKLHADGLTFETNLNER